VIAVLSAAVCLLSSLPAASRAASPDATAPWVWPVAPPRITEPYRAPSHAYGPGHRGIDVASEAGTAVVAPADGVVAFAGVVVDRGVLTIDHGAGVVSTVEPIDALVAPGDVVNRGQVVGTSDAAGGHTRVGELHIGARENGEYVNPLRFLGGIARAVLLPCCEVGHEPG